MGTPVKEFDPAQADAWNLAAGGESLLVTGGPGTGKTALARGLFADALSDNRAGHAWAPALLMTPDRHRSVAAEAALSADLVSGSTVGLSRDGSHRLVRSLDSYSYLVAALWLVEREEPLPRPPLSSGAREDAWLAAYLDSRVQELEPRFSQVVLASPSFRMEIRNLMARAGQFGLCPSDFVLLAQQVSLPLWSLAAEAYGAYAGQDAAFTVRAEHIDSARLPRIAASLIRNWEADRGAEAVLTRAPIPKLLIVDDAQDLPESARPLLAALAEAGSQVIVTSSAQEAVAQFRGGVPTMGQRLAADLGLRPVQLNVDHRSRPSAARVVREVEAWLAPGVRPDAEAKEPAPAEVDVSALTVELLPTRSQHDARVASLLREANVYHGTDWSDMAVIVRRAGSIEPLQQSLLRSGVPIRGGERPVVLSKVPICAALLQLLAPDAPGEPEERDQQARQLLTSPLVGADSLAVLRALREFRRQDPSHSLYDLADLLDAAAGDPKTAHGVRELVRRAALLWGKRSAAASLPAQEGLWALWEAAGVAEELRETALGEGWRAHVAAEELDAVLALFRKADLWQQERAALDLPPGDARTFAEELLVQSVATDPLIPRGLEEAGVSVVTSTQAAGQEWSMVVLAGVEEGNWPSGAGDSLGQVRRLEAALEDARSRGWPGEVPVSPFLPDRGAVGPLGALTGQQERRVEDARLFLVGLSRSSGELHLLAVDNEDSAPSTFLSPLEEEGLIQRVKGGAPGRLQTLRDAALRMRRVLMEDDASAENKGDAAAVLAILKDAGVTVADPALWALTGSISTDSPLLASGPIRLSPSAVESAQKCGLRWFLQAAGGAVQDLAEDTVDLGAARLGTLVHKIAEAHPKGTTQELLEALDRAWADEGFSFETVWERKAYLGLQEKLRRLAAYSAGIDAEVLTEQRIRFEVPGAVISGRADRVEVFADGSARVTDIKTGSLNHMAKAEVNPQLWVYQLGVMELGYPTAGAALLALNSERNNVLEQAPLSVEGAAEKRGELGGLVEQISGSKLLATPSDALCRLCPFQEVCPAVDSSARSHE